MTTSTFPALLEDQLRRAGARPLVTFYDDATGERVELSVVTYANWVAKTAGLLQDELDVARGATVLVDLPTHWLGPVWLGAVWSVGGCVTGPGGSGGAGGSAAPDLLVCGPDTVERYAGGGTPVVALALLPMGARFATPLPDGVVDYGDVVWEQPDSFVALDPPGPSDPAWRDSERELTQASLVGEAAGGPVAALGSRLLTEVNPCTRAGLVTFTAPLARGGGTVWVRNGAPDGWEQRASTERATPYRP